MRQVCRSNFRQGHFLKIRVHRGDAPHIFSFQFFLLRLADIPRLNYVALHLFCASGKCLNGNPGHVEQPPMSKECL